MKQGIIIFLLLFSLQAEANEWQELLRIPDVTIGEFSNVTVIVYHSPIKLPDERITDLYCMRVIREDGSLISTELLIPKNDNSFRAVASQGGIWKAQLFGVRTPLQFIIWAETSETQTAKIKLCYFEPDGVPSFLSNRMIDFERYAIKLFRPQFNREISSLRLEGDMPLSDISLGTFRRASGALSLSHVLLPDDQTEPFFIIRVTQNEESLMDVGFLLNFSCDLEQLSISHRLYFPLFSASAPFRHNFQSRQPFEELLSQLRTGRRPPWIRPDDQTRMGVAQRTIQQAPQDFLTQLPTLLLSPMEEINLLQTVHERLGEDLKNLFWTRMEDFIHRAVKTDVAAALMGLHYVHDIINEIPNSLEWREIINALSHHPNRFIRREAFRILNGLARLNLIGREGKPRWSSPRIQEIMESLYKDLFQQGYSPLLESPNTNNRLHPPRAQLPQRNSIPRRRLLLRLADLSGTEVDSALQQVLIFDHSLRPHALTLLHQRRALTTDSLSIILDLATSPYDAIRHVATHVLGDFSGPEAEQILLQRLDDANMVIVETALEALGRRPRSDAVLHALGSLIENLRERHDRAPTSGNRGMIQNVYTCLVSLGAIPHPPPSSLPMPQVLVQEGNTFMPLYAPPEFFYIGEDIVDVNAVMALLPHDLVWDADLCEMSSPQHVQRFLQESLQKTLLSLGLSETVVSQMLTPSTSLIEQMAQTGRLYSTPAARMAHWRLSLGGLLRLVAR